MAGHSTSIYQLWVTFVYSKIRTNAYSVQLCIIERILRNQHSNKYHFKVQTARIHLYID